MARPKVKVSANQTRSIVSRYGKGEGLVAISEALDLGVQIIRRILGEQGVEVRGRGRPALA